MHEELLLPFLLRAVETPQIGSTHISLYATLVSLYIKRGCEPVLIKRKEVMLLAKISPATYHKSLRALIDCGFLVYYPCSDPRGSSEIYFVRDRLEKANPDE